MYKYIISICLLVCTIQVVAQETTVNKVDKTKDSIVYKSPYGIRLGIDISKPIKAAVDGEYNSGLEIVADYRISKRLYLATEIGFENETTKEDYTNSTAKGSYIRLGFNYNAYENWLDMNNEIFMGFRYGFSVFEQTLNSFTPNISNTYFPGNQATNINSSENLNTHWTEFMFGVKVETFKNFFIGASISYKVLINTKEPDDFKTLYSPGFNRIFESGTGFGFNYTISYLIPFKKK
ncbi:MAG: hypothetical protein HWD82_00055 [Flavobacteriaceae bacterium]|nr:hypothetical protein [Flavobacteriaceae bacterium]